MDSRKTKNQARLRLVKSDDFDLCSSCNASAASPLGSAVRPCSMSLTDDAVSPTMVPISASVIPVPRRSEMREAHEVIPSILRRTVEASQRLPVTEFRDNHGMPRPANMPKDLKTVGDRVRWWRTHKKVSRKDFAREVGYSYSGLADLENNRSNGSEHSHLIAAKLGLNAHYLQTGHGEPEAAYSQEPPPPAEDWPFPAVPPTRLRRMTKIERTYIETRLLEAVAEVESERRNKTA